MRLPRAFIKNRPGGTYLHVYNHVIADSFQPYPLDNEIHREVFFQFCQKHLIKYNLEIISLVCMGNHFHCLVYCPEEKMTIEQATMAYNHFHDNDKYPKKVGTDSYEAEHVQKSCNDISEYMREVQRAYTLWYNKSSSYKRRGHLWQSRFQTQLIESSAYLWACLKYIEMNPVRAGICATAGDFSGSTFGRWSETGKHTFEDAFLKHIVSLAHDCENVSIDDFQPYLSSELARMCCTDEMKKLISCGNQSEAQLLEDLFREQSEAETLNIEVITFSIRDYHSQKFIGSKEFIAKEYNNWLTSRPTHR